MERRRVRMGTLPSSPTRTLERRLQMKRHHGPKALSLSKGKLSGAAQGTAPFPRAEREGPERLIFSTEGENGAARGWWVGDRNVAAWTHFQSPNCLERAVRC